MSHRIVFDVEQAMRSDDKKLCEQCHGTGQSDVLDDFGDTLECGMCGGSGLWQDEARRKAMRELRESLEQKLIRVPNSEEKIRDIVKETIEEAQGNGAPIADWSIDAVRRSVNITLQVVKPVDYIILGVDGELPSSD